MSPDLPLGLAHADWPHAEELDAAISVSVFVEPALRRGWRFGNYPGSDRDDLNRVTYLHEIYTRPTPITLAAPRCPFSGTSSAETIVNNESADILRMLNSGFSARWRDMTVDLYPE